MTTAMLDDLTGANLVGGVDHHANPRRFQAHDPRTGKALPLEVAEATADEVAEAARLAGDAAPRFSAWPLADRARLLRAVADALDADGEVIIAIADAETALGTTRLTGELARTSWQLRKFADTVEEGAFLEATVDHADGDDIPPRPDLRRMLVPLGPVAVFGASNFPLAFSVPGGDTAAALAAGCPVVVKGHPSHPATSERTARTILRALAEVGAPSGTFGLVQGAGTEVGAALVNAPQIAAVGFTGSQGAGRALHDLAAARPVPIPVYAEMSSVNPLFVTAEALSARGEEIADGLLGSMTMGTGQFCTKPGVVVLEDGAATEAFAARLAAGAGAHDGGPLLNDGIRAALAERVATTAGVDGVDVLAAGDVSGDGGYTAKPAVLRTTAERFLAEPQLAAEHFGPAVVLVVASAEEMVTVAESFDGQLTATVHAESAEEVAELLPVLVERVGRIVWNAYPTGVAVSAAQHHGGPYPSTTSVLHTSVGSTAVRRFLRPVAFQGAPDAALPHALRDANPLGIPRRVDGVWEG